MSDAARAFARERCELVIADLRQSGFDIVGDLDELLPRSAAGGGSSKELSTEEVSDADVLDAAIGSLATVLRNQFRPPPPAPQESRLVDIGGARVTASRRTTRRLRELSNRYPAFAKLRVWAWRMTERSRSRGKQR
jgi:hypothetical protein